MKRGNLRNFLVLLTVVSLVGLGANAFAGRGRGHGPGWMRGAGGYGCNNPYNSAGIAEEDLAKLDQERQSFFKQTEDLRAQIAVKETELRNELAKESPDAAKASEIQKALSDLNSQFDQKRLDHRIRMRQIHPDAGPNAGPGYMRGYMMGRGPGMGGFGPGMGTGPRGGGYYGYGSGQGPCW